MGSEYPAIESLADDYPVTHLVNNHIEMTDTPTLDAIGTTWQPDEPPMQMTLSMLDVAVDAIDELLGQASTSMMIS